MKKIKNLLFILLLMTVSVCALSFSAGAEFVTHEYTEVLSNYNGGSITSAPYLVKGEYKGLYRYSFDPDTGVLMLAPGDEETTVLPRALLWGEYTDDNVFPGGFSYKGIVLSQNSEKIKHIIVEDGFTEIHGTFSGLRALETIILPETLTVVGNCTFKNCNSLKNFILPDSVTKIGSEYVFSGCNSLSKVYYSGKADLVMPGNVPVPEKVKELHITPLFPDKYIRNSRIEITWEGDADYYSIYRWDYNANKWILFDQSDSTQKRSVYYCDIISGQKYRFAVRPYNKIANSIALADFTADTFIYLASPNAQAKPLPNGYQLSWDAVQGAQGYQIWYRTAETSQYKFYKNVKGTTFTKTGLKKGTTYYFSVRAYAELPKGNYQYSDFNYLHGITIGIPNKLNNAEFIIQAHSEDIHNPNAKRYIELSWRGNADYYRIYKWDYNKGEWKIIVDFTKETSYRYTDNVKLGEKYRFAVRPIMKDGNTYTWNDFIAKAIVDLEYEPKLEITTFEGGYTMTWEKIPGVENYQIMYKKDNADFFALYKTVTDTTFTKTGLTKGTTYQIYIKPIVSLSKNEWYSGKISNTVTITIP